MRKLSRRSKLLVFTAAIIVCILAVINRTQYPISIYVQFAMFVIVAITIYLSGLNITADYEIKPNRKLRHVDVEGAILICIIFLEALWLVVYGVIGIIYDVKFVDIICFVFGCTLFILFRGGLK